MKQRIIQALETVREDIEAPWFCRLAIKGGYENFMRDFLYEGLLKIGETDIDTEVSYPPVTLDQKAVNRLDIVAGPKNNLRYLIELGHNGTWQDSFAVVNHAISDINRSFDYNIVARERYSVSLLTNIKALNYEELYRIRRTYRKNVCRIVESKTDHTPKTRDHFKRIDTRVEEIIFTTRWNTFEADIHVFVCGPFSKRVYIYD